MSAQQTDAEIEEAVDYSEQAKRVPIAEIDSVAIQIPLMSQSQIYTATHEPNVQSTYTPNDSLMITAQNKLTDINLGGLSSCKVDPLKAGNWILWKTRIHKFFNLYEITDIVHSVKPMPEDPSLACKWLGKDSVTQALITNNINNQQMNHIVDAFIWENLQSIHETVGLAGIMAAKCHLLNTCAEYNTNIVKHINNL